VSIDCFFEKVTNVIYFPFKLTWFVFVTFLIGSAFVAWWGFLFGSVVGVVLVLIFMPDLFLLPLAISILYAPLFSDKESICSKEKEYEATKHKEEKDWLADNPILLVIAMLVGMIGIRFIANLYE